LRVKPLVDAQLIPLPRAFPDKFDVGNYCRDLLDRMKSLPGVETVSMSSFSPLLTMSYNEDIRRADSAERAILQAPGEFVTDGFLSTMRIPLLQGHDFSRSDNSRSQKTAIVSRSLATRLFPHGNALGRHIQFGTEPETRDLEIVGVAADARLEDIRADDLTFVYFNFWQHPESGNWGNLQVRYASSTSQMTSAIRSELQKIGRQYALHLRPISEQRDYSLLREKLLATLGILFAVLALTLAAVGLFGLLSFLVASRTSEIGVRIALGAERSFVRWLVLREALLLVGMGIALGLPVCYAGVRIVSSLLYRISPMPVIPLVASIVVLCCVAVTAALIPAHRASSVDPMVALRQE
jgi:predicted permease